jgi:hypothetical protein
LASCEEKPVFFEMTSQKHDIATREEALALLTEHARKGSATAAAALARELRAEKQREDRELAELADLVGSK